MKSVVMIGYTFHCKICNKFCLFLVGEIYQDAVIIKTKKKLHQALSTCTTSRSWAQIGKMCIRYNMKVCNN